MIHHDDERDSIGREAVMHGGRSSKNTLRIADTRRAGTRSAGTRRGSVLVYSLLAMSVWIGITSLAVDFGQVMLAKNQLQFSADAAARAGAQGVLQCAPGNEASAALAAATAVAAENPVSGLPVQLTAADVVVGNWDSSQNPAFSTARTPINAVQVTAHRDSSRGSALPLYFGGLFGLSSFNLTTVAVAAFQEPESNYGIAGIDHVNFSSAGALAEINGDVVSNGDISVGAPLGLLVSVTGNAQSYGGTVTHGFLAQISGSMNPLSESLNYPAASAPSQNNNSQIASCLDQYNNFNAVGVAQIPAGTYVVHDLNLLADLDVNLQGPVTFYVTGAFNLAANVNLLGSPNTSPDNFNVIVVQGGTVNFLAPLLTPLCMNLYAPQSAISINVAVTAYSGTLIGRTLDINVPAASVFNEIKPGSQQATISLVQ